MTVVEAGVSGLDGADELDATGPTAAHTAVGRLAILLGRHGADALPQALDLLVQGLGLDSAVVRDESGTVHRVPEDGQLVDTAERPVVELPLGGAVPATLTVIGAAPGQLPLLRVAAAVLGLALSAALSATPAGDLVMLAEQDRDDLADSLHDGPVQQLVFARYAADAAVRGGDARETRDAVQSALVAMRRTMWHLRPRGADLAAALDELSLRLAEGGQRLLTVTVQAGAEGLGPAGTALAYRLVQSVALTGRAGDNPLPVTLRPAGAGVEVHLPPQPLPVPRLDRWDRRARALGGHLSLSAAGLVLHLPRTPSAPDPKAAS